MVETKFSVAYFKNIYIAMEIKFLWEGDIYRCKDVTLENCDAPIFYRACWPSYEHSRVKYARVRYARV